MDAMNKQTAHIENWVYEGGWLYGQISKHKRQDEFNSRGAQRTSTVIRLDLGNNTVETKNTIYTLGKPWTNENK